MKTKTLATALVASLLLIFPVLAVVPVHAVAVTGLYAAYWDGSFFGSPAPTWPTCPTASTPVPSPPGGVPSSTPPTVTETDPNINFGSSTGFYWDESYAVSGPPTPGPPGNPGGFAVTQGGYGIAISSWGDKTLYSDYPSSTYFVDTDFSVEWTGYIHLTGDTTYYFELESDDGSMLYINPTAGSTKISSADTVISSWSVEAPSSSYGSFTPATTGFYAIEVDYFETCNTQSGIDLLWSTAASGYTIIPSSAFTPAQIGSNSVFPPPPVPQFPVAAPIVAAIGLLALVLFRKGTLPRIGKTA